MINVDEFHELVADYLKENLTVDTYVTVDNHWDCGDTPCKRVKVTTQLYLGSTLISESTASDYN